MLCLNNFYFDRFIVCLSTNSGYSVHISTLYLKSLVLFKKGLLWGSQINNLLIPRITHRSFRIRKGWNSDVFDINFKS